MRVPSNERLEASFQPNRTDMMAECIRIYSREYHGMLVLDTSYRMIGLIAYPIYEVWIEFMPPTQQADGPRVRLKREERREKPTRRNSYVSSVGITPCVILHRVAPRYQPYVACSCVFFLHVQK